MLEPITLQVCDIYIHKRFLIITDLEDPYYIGLKQQRIRGVEYDAFIEEFVTAVHRKYKHILIQVCGLCCILSLLIIILV